MFSLASFTSSICPFTDTKVNKTRDPCTTMQPGSIIISEDKASERREQSALLTIHDWDETRKNYYDSFTVTFIMRQARHRMKMFHDAIERKKKQSIILRKARISTNCFNVNVWPIVCVSPGDGCIFEWTECETCWSKHMRHKVLKEEKKSEGGEMQPEQKEKHKQKEEEKKEKNKMPEKVRLCLHCWQRGS